MKITAILNISKIDSEWLLKWNISKLKKFPQIFFGSKDFIFDWGCTKEQEFIYWLSRDGGEGTEDNILFGIGKDGGVHYGNIQ